MPFTRTGSGVSPSQRARQIQRAARAIVREVGDVEIEAVEALTPTDTGTLERGMEEHDFTDEHASIAPVGDPSWHTDDSAPGGTISAFVKEYIRTHGERPGHTAGDMSWHTLSEEQKDLLRAYRKTGNTAMGGPYPPPVYFGAVDQGKVPGGDAGNIGFANDIKEYIKVRIPGIIQRHLGGP